MKKQKIIVLSIFLIAVFSYSYAHLCDNVFRQADKLIVKPESYNMVVKDKTEFKVFLQNNMDESIAEISLIAESPAFDFQIAPKRMSIPKDQRVYFKVTMSPKPATLTGNYPINFRLVGGGRQFKSFSLTAGGDSTGSADAENNEKREKKPANAQSKILKVPRAPSKPKFDGVMNDQCWQSASVATNFTSLTGGDPKNQTVVVLMFDEKYLYAGICCFDEDDRKLGPGDYVEMRISENASGYPNSTFLFPASGIPSAKRYLGVTNSSGLKMSDIRYCITNDTESWRIEAGLPFSVLSKGSYKLPKKFYMRVTRVNNTGKKEKCFWAADSSGYNKKDGFGEFLLVP